MSASSPVSLDRWRYRIARFRERLWVRPLVLCFLSIGGVFLAKLADDAGLADILPRVSQDSVESLLSVMASSMLTIATLAVGSMVAAYASASNRATPRSTPLVIADDVTQNALSAFLGAFIFSLIGLVTVKNAYFAEPGLFTVFVLTLLVFGLVVLTFVRWVDRIARLGRLSNTVEQVEAATRRALDRRRRQPTLCGVPTNKGTPTGRALYAGEVGYVQSVDMAALQEVAEASGVQVTLAALPGTFACAGQPLVYIEGDGTVDMDDRLLSAVTIGRTRTFEDDPRFGLVVLSEIAGRALSPAINDPGTAIEVIGTLIRLFTRWASDSGETRQIEVLYDRVAVPRLLMDDMLDDGFVAIERDGAAHLEVAVRLQKAFASLMLLGDEALRSAAQRHAHLALARAEDSMARREDFEAVRAANPGCAEID